MNYWLDLFTPDTWTRFRDHGADISGFRPRQRKAAFGRVKKGDKFVCYLVKLSRWCGVLEVLSDAFDDVSPIFAEENDPFPIRFKVRSEVMLDFELSIPIEIPDVWNNLSFTHGIIAGSFGWAQTAHLCQSLIQLHEADGELLCRILKQQTVLKKRYELDPANWRSRFLTRRTKTRAGSRG